jgi:hypothetical protein
MDKKDHSATVNRWRSLFTPAGKAKLAKNIEESKEKRAMSGHLRDSQKLVDANPEAYTAWSRSPDTENIAFEDFLEWYNFYTNDRENPLKDPEDRSKGRVWSGPEHMLLWLESNIEGFGKARRGLTYKDPDLNELEAKAKETAAAVDALSPEEDVPLNNARTAALNAQIDLERMSAKNYRDMLGTGEGILEQELKEKRSDAGAIIKPDESLKEQSQAHLIDSAREAGLHIYDTLKEDMAKMEKLRNFVISKMFGVKPMKSSRSSDINGISSVLHADSLKYPADKESVIVMGAPTDPPAYSDLPDAEQQKLLVTGIMQQILEAQKQRGSKFTPTELHSFGLSDSMIEQYRELEKRGGTVYSDKEIEKYDDVVKYVNSLAPDELLAKAKELTEKPTRIHAANAGGSDAAQVREAKNYGLSRTRVHNRDSATAADPALKGIELNVNPRDLSEHSEDKKRSLFILKKSRGATLEDFIRAGFTPEEIERYGSKKSYKTKPKIELVAQGEESPEATVAARSRRIDEENMPSYAEFVRGQNAGRTATVKAKGAPPKTPADEVDLGDISNLSKEQRQKFAQSLMKQFTAGTLSEEAFNLALSKLI